MTTARLVKAKVEPKQKTVKVAGTRACEDRPAPAFVFTTTTCVVLPEIFDPELVAVLVTITAM